MCLIHILISMSMCHSYLPDFLSCSFLTADTAYSSLQAQWKEAFQSVFSLLSSKLSLMDSFYLTSDNYNVVFQRSLFHYMTLPTSVCLHMPNLIQLIFKQFIVIDAAIAAKYLQ